MDIKTETTYRQIYGWAENAVRPGGEFDWFAIDAEGKIAAFLTGGFGPIPDLFFGQGVESYLTLVDLIESRLGCSSAIHSGGFEPISERGLFAYDFKAMDSGRYEIAATPSDPITFFEVRKFGLSRNMFVEFSGRFEDCNQIIPENFWNCR